MNKCLAHENDLYSRESMLKVRRYTARTATETYTAVIAKTSVLLASVNHPRQSDTMPLKTAMAARRCTSEDMLTSTMIEMTGSIEAMKHVNQNVIVEIVVSR